jgi:hypothetical protein
MALTEDFRHFLFIIYRILPFVVVAYFFITAILSGDLSGFLILVGLILFSIITILVSKTEYMIDLIFNNYNSNNTTNTIDGKMNFISTKLSQCNFITLGGSPLSYLPLSTYTYWFLFGYFVYVMNLNNVLAKNWGLMLVMTILLFIDGYYNFSACVGSYIWIPSLIGVLSGVFWANIIGAKNHMIPMLSRKSQCSAQASRYSCRIKRTGQIVST